jgi:hypothetical protein
VTVDTLAPDAPDNLNLAPEGTPLTGTAEAGSIITVKDSNGNVIGTGVATAATSPSLSARRSRMARP